MQSIFRLLSCIAILGLMSGCQSLIPEPKGLKTALWPTLSTAPSPLQDGQAQQQTQAQEQEQTQIYQRQDQVEVLWKQQGFSFLLYQQQQGKTLDFLALSLTGQQLFKLQFDGQQVKVEQRIEQMKMLPFAFVVRDILYATYPKFAQLEHEQVELKQQDQATEIYIQQQKVLNIAYQPDHIVLDNLQVPYQMIFSPVDNTLQEDQAP